MSSKVRHLMAAGIPRSVALDRALAHRGYWRTARSRELHAALPDRYWADQGLKGFTDPYHRLRDAKRTARCGPARRVVWEAPG